MRKGAKAAVIGSVFAVMLGGAGYGAYNLVTAVSGGTGRGGRTRAGEDRAAERRRGQGDQPRVLRGLGEGRRGEGGRVHELRGEPPRACSPATATTRTSAGVRITPGTVSGATVPFSSRRRCPTRGRASPSRTTRN